MTKSEIYAEILSKYERDRNAARHEMQKRRDEVYSKIPAVEEIDREISKTGSIISKIFFEDEDKQKSIEELRIKTADLRNYKAELLEKNGFSPKYLNQLYVCRDCKDTGYIGNKKCHCFNKMLVEKYYKLSNLGKLVKKQNFASFDIGVFSNEIPSGESISPRENMQKMLPKIVEKTKLMGDQAENMLFYGSSGLGKTFLCSCIAKEVMDNGKTVLYMTAMQMFDALSNYNARKTNSDENLEMLNDADLLIIDDIGTENINSYTNSSLFNIVNSRLIDEKSTIISTNLQPRELRQIYSERFVSRLLGNYELYRFFGRDIRLYN